MAQNVVMVTGGSGRVGKALQTMVNDHGKCEDNETWHFLSSKDADLTYVWINNGCLTKCYHGFMILYIPRAMCAGTWRIPNEFLNRFAPHMWFIWLPSSEDSFEIWNTRLNSSGITYWWTIMWWNAVGFTMWVSLYKSYSLICMEWMEIYFDMTQVQKLVSCLSTCIFPDKTSYPIDETMVCLLPYSYWGL